MSIIHYCDDVAKHPASPIAIYPLPNSFHLALPNQEHHTDTSPSPPTFTDKHAERDYLKGRLAAAFRIFGKYGFDEGVAGHITLRDPVQPDCFWVNRLGMDFGRIHLAGGALALYLFGLPGQVRFQPLWEDLAHGALGCLVLADTRDLDASHEALGLLEDQGIP